MKTLFLAWQDRVTTRAWYPIGRLDADLAKSRFQFGYTHGAELAHQRTGLKPLDAFPNFNGVYESGQLFPLFQNRILGEDRKDFQEYLRQLDLTPEEANPLAILSLTGGERQTTILKFFQKSNATRTVDFGAGFSCTVGGTSMRRRSNDWQR